MVRGKFPLKIFNRNTLTEPDRNYMRIMNNICFYARDEQFLDVVVSIVPPAKLLLNLQIPGAESGSTSDRIFLGGQGIF